MLVSPLASLPKFWFLCMSWLDQETWCINITWTTVYCPPYCVNVEYSWVQMTDIQYPISPSFGKLHYSSSAWPQVQDRSCRELCQQVLFQLSSFSTMGSLHLLGMLSPCLRHFCKCTQSLAFPGLGKLRLLCW